MKRLYSYEIQDTCLTCGSRNLDYVLKNLKEDLEYYKGKKAFFYFDSTLMYIVHLDRYEEFIEWLNRKIHY